MVKRLKDKPQRGERERKREEKPRATWVMSVFQDVKGYCNEALLLFIFDRIRQRVPQSTWYLRKTSLAVNAVIWGLLGR